jgi:hypothetical protein
MEHAIITNDQAQELVNIPTGVLIETREVPDLPEGSVRTAALLHFQTDTN